jgi:hypothetical protein
MASTDAKLKDTPTNDTTSNGLISIIVANETVQRATHHRMGIHI